MFCPNCGKKLNDNANFCDSCGVAMSDFGVPNNQNIVVAKLKELLSSKLVLIIAILLSCAVVFSFGISEQSQVQNITEYDYEFSDKYFEYGNDYYHDYNDSNSYQTSIGFSDVSIWAVLSTIGAWLIFAAAKSKKNGMKTAPFTYFKVCNLVTYIISLVAFSCCAVSFAIVTILMFNPAFLNEYIYQLNMILSQISASLPYNISISGSVLQVAFAVATIIFAGAIVLQIFIYNKAKKTIVGLRDVVIKGEPTNNISPFIAVMCYINAAITAITAIATLVTTNVMAGIANLLYAVALILIGNLLLKLRREMTYFVPVQEGPVLAEQPQQQNQLEEQISE